MLRGGGGGGMATPPDPMNRFTQLMQLQQMQQNMMLAREQAGRQQQLFAPQLRAAQAAAETSELELGTKRLDKETSDKLWNVYQTEDDPYNPEIARRLRKTEPRVAAELEHGPDRVRQAHAVPDCGSDRRRRVDVHPLRVHCQRRAQDDVQRVPVGPPQGCAG